MNYWKGIELKILALLHFFGLSLRKISGFSLFEEISTNLLEFATTGLRGFLKKPEEREKMLIAIDDKLKLEKKQSMVCRLMRKRMF